MSAGNACAAIGLANSNKVPMIGGYVQDITQPVGPGANGPHIGVIGETFWDRNVMDELVDPAYTVPATSGAAAGKTAQWVTTGGSSVTVPADGRVTVTTGVIVSAVGTGLSKIYVPIGTVIPAGSFLWAFLI